MITVKNEQNKTQITVSGDIVSDTWKGWNWGESVETYPEDIRNLLKNATGTVEVIISSGGGDLFAGMAISNMLSRYEGHTKAIIEGVAASAASIIAFGCDEIEIPANAYLMIHKPSVGIYGNSDDLLKWADTLDRLQDGLCETYAKFAKENVTKEKINEYINRETWFTGNSLSENFHVTVTQVQDDKKVVGNCIYNYSHTPKELLGDTLEDKIKIALAMN